ncbi:glycosyltransferase family 2 protein [Enterobacter hormaechei subsp. xiangfangensis]|uniref:glycosyltransferase family A protein n=1 Tax=Enterobacter hormaechei TaxID=158836 RepID=UPI001BE3F8DD|nr:glycosyltransferase family A protein [Enterobacter hormaechei]MCU3719813.1 glycosyltransferase family 2 protein [Enterobacter hormaechei subsp. steigerwaltii]MBT2205759.1 glycosyltransferase family 2 protein [Enterobacter hormaechei subsp. xiangfangensis]MBW9412777.1 glycosyltransferase family 2 protein [Enterobacter hormaechei]MCU2362212.1 glycosyltransferase family 2 protein [Enterobacter hormaechei subsp. xiangfangensis]MCU2754956.1 glycosyltransferase family 2 protein [Enterobacter horm
MQKNKEQQFPVVIMTRNEGRYLKSCVESIFHTVTIDILLYIIDNQSDDDEHNAILDDIEKRYREKVVVIRNEKNLWILGLNKTLKNIKTQHNSKYFVLTDGDIDFSNCLSESFCWLTYLIQKMEANIMVGKIGISLDWSFLEENTAMKEILQQEKDLYNEKRKIDDLYISAVDTTVAIYRWDWSIERSGLFYPDHMRYLRPELYSCRTSYSIKVEHLGWKKYLGKNQSKENINSKVFCFTIVGGTIKKEILAQASKPYQLFHILTAKLFSGLWYFRRYYKLLIYFMTKGRRGFDGQS